MERLFFWSKDNPDDTPQIDEDFIILQAYMNETGILVILGKWANSEVIPLEDRIDQATYIIQKAKDLGVPG